MMVLFNLSACLFLGLAAFVGAEIPSYIHVCKANDPDLGQCIIKSIEELKPKLKEGIPELEVPGIEPLHLDEIKLRSGPNGAKINANITDIQVWGPSDFIIHEIRPNLNRNKFAFKVTIPHLYFKGNYDMDMHILVLKYSGQGPIVGNFTDYNFDCIMKGNRIKKNDEEYLEFGKMFLRLNLGKSTIHLGNLFAQDPILARATNDVISDNTDVFINEIKPVLESTLASKFTEIANKITTTFTYKELFPLS